MNNVLWILALLAHDISGQFVSVAKRIRVQPKIVGGIAIDIKNIPFLLSFHIKSDGFWCGASIISEWYGMTALHCMKPQLPSPQNYFVRAGSSLNIIGGYTYNLRKFYKYDNSFNVVSHGIPDHDILLFRVATPFRFTNNVQPAKLPGILSASPQLLRTAGWGVTNPSGQPRQVPMHLRAANVSQVAWKDCLASSSWYGDFANEKRHLCYGGTGADSCYGDSGGPLADSDTVYGIVSFGEGCGKAPGIYAKVSFYRRWIHHVTQV